MSYPKPKAINLPVFKVSFEGKTAKTAIIVAQDSDKAFYNCMEAFDIEGATVKK